MTTTHAPLSLTSININSPGGYRYRDVQLVVVDGVATINFPSGTPAGGKSGVTSVEHPTTNAYRVTFDDGDIWTVTRPGCGCGG